MSDPPLVALAEEDRRDPRRRGRPRPFLLGAAVLASIPAIPCGAAETDRPTDRTAIRGRIEDFEGDWLHRRIAELDESIAPGFAATVVAPARAALQRGERLHAEEGLLRALDGAPPTEAEIEAGGRLGDLSIVFDGDDEAVAAYRVGEAGADSGEVAWVLARLRRVVGRWHLRSLHREGCGAYATEERLKPEQAADFADSISAAERLAKAAAEAWVSGDADALEPNLHGDFVGTRGARGTPLPWDRVDRGNLRDRLGPPAPAVGGPSPGNGPPRFADRAPRSDVSVEVDRLQPRSLREFVVVLRESAREDPHAVRGYVVVTVRAGLQALEVRRLHEETVDTPVAGSARDAGAQDSVGTPSSSSER